ncbi:phosphate ABC transporter substrate-binding/OmpA family protein [Actibacterium sp. 188UL27-1]|uniref:phosphate ABC transporter substrate-binding/OmpA family protein n=1 Tax=Actibacterium sp. 188UL27-1 TaxID=2786961 RepID=UPI001958B192|nr:phosphate ABC transporter substrate-binding/OmpA family protein [Actibacterium sp. 188UL27-1]MBM7067285.1 substrate-binding domain-containing protein [Actibacterium sp. 188UL27-1]
MSRIGALAVLIVGGMLVVSTPLHAQEVQLMSSDGTVNVTGELIDFEENTYRIRTALGEFRFAANRVRCVGDACPDLSQDEVDIIVSGSDEVGAGLMPLLLEGYSGARNAEATLRNTALPGQLVANLISDQGFGDDLASIQVTSTNATAGLTDLLAKKSDIAMTSRRIVPQEAQAFAASGAGDMRAPAQEHILAVDSLIVITNPSNTITTLDVRQLFGIYSGAITNWAQVGGPDLPVQVVIRNVGENRRDAFESSFFGSAEVSLTQNAQVVPDSNAVAQFVNGNAGAIGVVGYAFQRGASTINIINQCGITMVPDAFSAKTEEYALQRRLYLYTRADQTTPAIEDFMTWSTSAEADGVIRKAGFIGFNVDRREQSRTDVRARAMVNAGGSPAEKAVMQRMLAAMDEYDRLSTTFRFETGSALLDERGQIDKARLVDYLESQPAGSDVLFVGFTDSIGQFDYNLGLAESRAGEVMRNVQSFAGDRLANLTMSSLGYGEISPSGCNASDQGRRINRRTEVWIKSPG